MNIFNSDALSSFLMPYHLKIPAYAKDVYYDVVLRSSQS